MAKGRTRKRKIQNAPLGEVNEFARQHGDYVPGIIVDMSGEHGEGRNRTFKAVLNRGGTAIDRWIVNDRQGLFDEPQQRAIRYTQNLWLRVEGGLRAVDTTADVIDSVLGWSQQEADRKSAG